MSTDERSELGRKLAALRRRERKTCPVCGTEFEGLTGRRGRVYCSVACKLKDWRRRRKVAGA